MRHTYEISLEIAGPFAMFARPDTGSTPISYPVPTFSAAKGMFEAVARLESTYFCPTHVEICRPVLYERYVTNYGGPLRKSDQVKKGNNYQLMATVLVDVCYRIYAQVRGKQSTRGAGISRVRARSGRTDHCQRLRDLFEQRLSAGQTYYTPCLGWKEFVPAYFGPLRSETQPETSVNLVIPSLLHDMWDHKKVKPTFRQDWEIIHGVMSYERRRPDDAE